MSYLAAVQSRGGPGRTDLRSSSALALRAPPLPEGLADLIGGVPGGPHHCGYSQSVLVSVIVSTRYSPEEKNESELLAALACSTEPQYQEKIEWKTR